MKTASFLFFFLMAAAGSMRLTAMEDRCNFIIERDQEAPAERAVARKKPETAECAMKSVSIVVPEGAGPVMKNIAALLARRIEERCKAKAAIGARGDLKIELSIRRGIGAEGFCISTGKKGSIRIIGNDERGVLYGAGKFLRTSNYSGDGFAAGKWRGSSVPEKPVRGMYLATHFYNYYQAAPVAEVQRYIEDLALWGVNTILLWYDMHHFKGFDDPTAEQFRDRLKKIMETARKLDVGIGFTMTGNEGYANSPVNVQAAPGVWRGGHYPTDICPNKPGGMEYILETRARFFDWCRDYKPEYICIWPYDQGGCGSPDCRPWGSNGFLKCAKAIAAMAREKFPGVKVILSTWYFDSTEWKGLSDQLAFDRSWSDMILAEGEPPGKERIDLPIVGFPEISMYNTFPWGGFGATPLPDHLLRQWQLTKGQLSGGFPYSEGIFDDISKVVYAQLYWNSAIPPQQTIKEYIFYEFSPEAVAGILKVIRILERNHHMRWWPGELEGVKLTLDWFPSKNVRPMEDPGAEEAYRIVRQWDNVLPEKVRQSWRWRILYIRALLDAELKANGGSPNGACRDGFKELMKIYHTTEQSDPAVRPPVRYNYHKRSRKSSKHEIPN